MQRTPKAELDRRLSRLQEHVTAEGLDGALLHGPTNLYYYAGTAQQAHLWVPADGEPVLLVRRVFDRARAESALERVEPLASLKELPGYVGGAKRIGMELDIMPVSLFVRYQKALPEVEAQDIGPYTRLARSVKSPWELERTREAARVADAAYREVVQALREGMTELELSAIAQGAERRHGHQGLIRWRAATGFECPPLHVLVGESLLAFTFTDTPFGGEGLTPAVPYGAGRRVIRRGMPVCVDSPTGVSGYIHDYTRTLSVGPLDSELKNAYAVCREIHGMVRSEVRPGLTGEEVWNKCLEIARQAGLEEHFMGWGANRVKFVGHGVGLELDELPVLAPRQRQVLEPGNVIAVEPKFFFPGKGAVGLENTYVVTEAGVEQITLSSEELVEK